MPLDRCALGHPLKHLPLRFRLPSSTPPTLHEEPCDWTGLQPGTPCGPSHRPKWGAGGTGAGRDWNLRMWPQLEMRSWRIRWVRVGSAPIQLDDCPRPKEEGHRPPGEAMWHQRQKLQ